MARLRHLKSDERDVVKALLAEFANAGYINLDRPEEEIWEQFHAVAQALDDDFEPVIDHTPDLLSRARAAKKEDNFSVAVLMYATWVEHVLNMILIQLAVGKRMLERHCNSMIKEASLRAKSTWLLPLLGGKPLSDQTVTRIQRLADVRNAYIHYKWGQTYSAARSDQERALADAEKLVKSLQSYRIKEGKMVSRRSKTIRSLVR